MATAYNAQICRGENKYSLQFETDNYEYFKEVERACRKVGDKKDKEIHRERCSRMRVMGHL